MGAKKHEIYVATLGGHLFLWQIFTGPGLAMAPWSPVDPLLVYDFVLFFFWGGVGCLWSQVPFLVTGPMSLLLEGGR